MEIEYLNRRVQKQCTQEKELRKLGNLEPRLRVLLRDIELADNLSRLVEEHPTLEELKGKRKGQLSVRIIHTQAARLIFVPGNQPIATKPDGGLDWDRTTTIIITEINRQHYK